MNENHHTTSLGESEQRQAVTPPEPTTPPPPQYQAGDQQSEKSQDERRQAYWCDELRAALGDLAGAHVSLAVLLRIMKGQIGHGHFEALMNKPGFALDDRTVQMKSVP